MQSLIGVRCVTIRLVETQEPPFQDSGGKPQETRGARRPMAMMPMRHAPRMASAPTSVVEWPGPCGAVAVSWRSGTTSYSLYRRTERGTEPGTLHQIHQPSSTVRGPNAKSCPDISLVLQRTRYM
jgi:hypothetical protein